MKEEEQAFTVRLPSGLVTALNVWAEANNFKSRAAAIKFMVQMLIQNRVKVTVEKIK